MYVNLILNKHYLKYRKGWGGWDFEKESCDCSCEEEKQIIAFQKTVKIPKIQLEEEKKNDWDWAAAWQDEETDWPSMW